MLDSDSSLSLSLSLSVCFLVILDCGFMGISTPAILVVYSTLRKKNKMLENNVK
jgi:hypothetical protein